MKSEELNVKDGMREIRILALLLGLSPVLAWAQAKVKSEAVKWARVVKESGYKTD